MPHDPKDFTKLLVQEDANKSYWQGNYMRRVRLGAMGFVLDYLNHVAKTADHATLVAALTHARNLVRVRIMGEDCDEAPPPQGVDPSEAN